MFTSENNSTLTMALNLRVNQIRYLPKNDAIVHCGTCVRSLRSSRGVPNKEMVKLGTMRREAPIDPRSVGD